MVASKTRNRQLPMKLKLMPMLVGAIALTGCLASALSVAASPVAVKGQANISEQLLVAQAQRQQRQGRWANLNLTQAQKDQMKQLHQQTRQKIEAVLTPQQLEQYKTARQNRRSQRQNGNGAANSSSQGQARRQGIFATLNLSEAQKTQIRQIKQSSKEQRNGILTDAQRTQLEQMRQSRMKNRAQ